MSQQRNNVNGRRLWVVCIIHKYIYLKTDILIKICCDKCIKINKIVIVALNKIHLKIIRVTYVSKLYVITLNNNYTSSLKFRNLFVYLNIANE